MSFTPFEGAYCNHIGSCVHPVDATVYLAVTFHPNGTGPFNLQVWKHAAPYTTPPILVRDWQQGQADSPGPFGFCTLECLPSGALYIGAAGGVQSASSIVPSYRIEPGLCAPFTAAQAGPQGPKGDTGPVGPVGPAGGASGGLSPEDVEALRRLKAWLGI
jgi:hypothetical protein